MSKRITYSVHLRVVVDIPDDLDPADAFDDWGLTSSDGGQFVVSPDRSYNHHSNSYSEEYTSHEAELLDVFPVDEVSVWTIS